MLNKFFATITIFLALSTSALASPFRDGLFAYYEGDYARAMNIWKPLAEEGHAKAQYNIGALYIDGIGVKQDLPKALEWLQKAAMQDETEALIELGGMYAHGMGVKQDHVKALEYYRLAVELGDYSVLSIFGYMYENGEGLPKNIELAYVWFSLATDFYESDGDKESRDRAAAQMTAEQIKKAQELADQCYYSSFAGCSAW